MTGVTLLLNRLYRSTLAQLPYTPGMRAYLQATGPAPVAAAADNAAQNSHLAADKDAKYDDVQGSVRKSGDPILEVRAVCACISARRSVLS